MSRKSLIALIIMTLIAVSSSAETIRIGKTDCLLQPSAETDSTKKYVLFVGSAEYFNACSSCKDIMAHDGDLLIPQGNGERVLCSAASDEVIRDIRPTLLSWAADGYEMILIGYSAGGYPATTLASQLAEEGYNGRLYLLDGVSGAYKSTYFNESYYRNHLATWDITIYASSDRYVHISERTRRIGSELADDENVIYHRYKLNHEGMKLFYNVIMNGVEAPEPVPEQISMP